jgi:nicotinate-nucleotide--dimethylbenzimidazole phosphoribosyltransferase
MNSLTLLAYMSQIKPRDELFYQQAKARQQILTKPPQSLGRLEELSCEIAAASRTLQPNLSQRSVLIFAGDHGVTEEGISAYPREVTAQMLSNFAAGGAAINALSRTVGASLLVVDVGVAAERRHAPNLRTRRVADGTQNFAKRPAMSEEQSLRAIEIGREIVQEEISRGVTCFAIGEMGIGNTTSASAITAALTGLSPREVTGRGTGLSDDIYTHKIEVIEAALRLHQPRTPLEILQCVGGLEIAAMVGAYLEIASNQKIGIFDGFISSAAAALAVSLCPDARSYLFASHRSVEPGHRALLSLLGREPLFDLQMRLGEGSGAALAMPILEAAVATFTQMATFEEAKIASS